MKNNRRVIAALAGTSALLAPGVAAGQTSTPPTVKAEPPRGPLKPQSEPVTEQAGMIRAHAGMIRAHIGDISPFWGDTKTYWGKSDPLGADTTAFWGKLTPYAGMIRAHEGQVTDMAGMIRAHGGTLSGMAGMIRAHWGELGAMAGMIRAHDGSGAAGSPKALADWQAFVAKSEAFWAAPILKGTGKSFRAGFADPLLAKYGVNLGDAASLARLTADRREQFFLAWYDGLMQFSGADQVDHWMKPIGWNPGITQQQGSGTRAVIGVIDYFAAADPDIKSKVIYSGGYATPATGTHGASVASLILASHDGKGIMGIAPNAQVAAYNPFDHTNSASWADVTAGIAKVTGAGANIVNLSLGVPGWTFHSEWRNVFKNSAVDSRKDATLYIIAAGNSGVQQKTNIEMNGALDSTFLVVGALGVDGKIASFSNQPGWTCLTDGGECKSTQRAGVGLLNHRFQESDYLKESGYLMNRFLVAPGELILVADGQGGVTRVSGTSFSAPLVAGAIALIHDRWPWLKKYPRDVAKILLDTATDLGETGADPVYGRGLVNIERAQSALDFDKLRYELWTGGKKNDYRASLLRHGGMKTTWEANGVYLSAFEKLDSGERDFLIPLSSRLFGTMRNGQYFQEFVYNHFVNWMATGVGFTGRRGFSDLTETEVAARPGAWSWSMSGRMTREHWAGGGMGRMGLRSAVTLRSPGQGFSFSAGAGDGALHLAGGREWNRSDDVNPYSGGVNPLLGFASGGAHLGATVAVAPGLAVSVGGTERRRTMQEELSGVTGEDRLLIGQQPRYQARAQNVRVDYRPARWLGVSASVTRLDEDRAFLGVRSLADSDFGRGTTTDGVTMQADVAAGDGLTVFGSATAARSASRDPQAAFRIADGAVGTAFQLGVAKTGVLGQADRLRMALSQPLTTERGTLDFTSVMVIDRETGEKGLVTQRIDLAGARPRRAVAEASYGAPLMQGRAEVSLFGRGELRHLDPGTPRVMGGGRFSVAF